MDLIQFNPPCLCLFQVRLLLLPSGKPERSVVASGHDYPSYGHTILATGIMNSRQPGMQFRKPNDQGRILVGSSMIGRSNMASRGCDQAEFI